MELRYAIFVFLISYSQLHSQENICFKSILKNFETQEIIYTQNIFINELNKNVSNHKDGVFKVCSIEPVLHIQIDGFNAFVFNSNDKKDTIYLIHKAIEQDEVIVTGLQGNLNTRKNTGSIIGLKQSALFNNGAANALDVLSKQNGVALITQGPGINKVSIRGLSHNRVGIIQDGIKLENQQWGDDHGIDINDLNLDKIEIIKWPTSLLYGSDAMGGVVNFISKQNRQTNSLQGNMSTNYNTNNQYVSSHVNLNTNVEGYYLGGWGNLKRAQDYQNKYDGYVLNSRFQENNFGFLAGTEKKWGHIDLTFNHYDKAIGLIEGERNEEGKFIYQDNEEEKIATQATSKTYTMSIYPLAYVKQTNAGIKFKYAFNTQHAIAFAAGWQRNERNEMVGEADTALHLNLQTVNYNLIYTFQKNKFKNHFGIIGMHQQNKIGGEEHLIPNYVSNEMAGVYVGDLNVNDKLFVGLGVRGDFRNLQTTALTLELDGEKDEHFKALNENYFNVSGNLSLSYKINSHVNLKSNISKGFRFPHVVELLSNGAHEGANRIEIGDAKLKPEENYQTDFSVSYENEHFLFKGEAFINYIFNYIYLRKQQNDDGTDRMMNNGGQDLQVFQYQQNKAFITGIELESDIHIHQIDWLHWGNKFSYIVGNFTQAVDASKNLPRIMSPIWTSELKASKELKNSIFKSVFFNVESIYNFSQDNFFKGYNTETVTPAYWLINAGFGTSINYKNQTVCNFFIGINNVLDIAYQNHLNTLKYKPENTATQRIGIFEMGRNFVFKINIPIYYSW